jgi:hypothetical protein
MHRQKKAFFVSLLAAFTLFPSLAFAGGPIASFYADTNGYVGDAGYGRVVRFYLRSDLACKGTEVIFKFADSQDGDQITTASGTNDYTFTEDRNSNGCSVYAKASTKNPGVRTINLTVINQGSTYTTPYAPGIKVDFDGKYHGDNQYDWYSYRTSTADPYAPFATPTPTPQVVPTVAPVPTTNPGNNNSGSLEIPANFQFKVWVLNQHSIGSGQRQVDIKWTAVNGNNVNVLNTIFVKPGHQESGKSNDAGWKFVFNNYGPSAQITIPDQDFTVKVRACAEHTTSCVDSDPLFLPGTHPGTTPVVTPVVSPNVTPAPSTPDDSHVQELNQRINNLENQLTESKKNQSVLEQRVNDLMSFIKRLFPFFK